ncbi:hypothetical protein [Pontibacter amylolyticus]|nr:hypothetical protein [Pontibacter amylolyticus]
MMEPISIPYHLLLPAIACIVFLYLIFIRRKKLFSNSKKRSLWITATILIAFYGLIVGGATFEDVYAQWDVNRYDLNSDGLFSSDEVTEEQEAAMFRLTSDVGRNLSVLTGLISTAVLALPIYILVRLIVKIKTPS